MKFKQKYDLPDGEAPAGAVTVVVSQKGDLYLVTPDNIDHHSVVSLLAGGIQIQVNKIREDVEEIKSTILRPPGLTSLDNGGNCLN